MRTLWNAVSFLAVANLLAMLLFVGWLWKSERLNDERVQRLREMLAMTISEEETQQAEATAAAVAVQAEREQELMRGSPSVPPSEQIQLISMRESQVQAARQRLRDDQQQLMQQLALREAALRNQEEAFEQRKTQWQDSIEAERTRRESEQFAKTIKQYELVPSKQAKQMLIELVQQGGREQAVAYLNGMNSRSASKILREFKAPAEVQLATELLEELRTFGFIPDDLEDSGNAEPNGAPQSP